MYSRKWLRANKIFKATRSFVATLSQHLNMPFREKKVCASLAIEKSLIISPPAPARIVNKHPKHLQNHIYDLIRFEEVEKSVKVKLIQANGKSFYASESRKIGEIYFHLLVARAC